MSYLAALGSLLACIFGGIEFEVLGREARFTIDIGVCYYLQVTISIRFRTINLDFIST